MSELDESIPATLPSCENDVEYEAASQILSGKEHQSYWGRLYPLTRWFQCHDLITDKVTLGTESSTINLSRVQLDHLKQDNNSFVRVDKKQLEICRSSLDSCSRVKVKISCLGKFDIFVSGRRLKARGNIGKKSATNLRHNDIISFSVEKSNTQFEAYIFIESSAPPIDHIPKCIHARYQVTLRLGMGAFGEVYLAYNKTTGCPSAMKSIIKNKSGDIRENHNRAKLLNEIEILRPLKHPHITELIDVMEYKLDTFMFLEFMEGKDLSHRILQNGKLKENEAKLIFYQIVIGVEFLHDHKIIHRDIKPANVLMATSDSETLVKLTDFGLSKVLSSTMHMKSICGTKMYAAPELLSAGPQNKYTAKVDVWSLGVLLYVSLSGTEPFAVEPHRIDEHISKGLYTMPPAEWNNVSVYAKNLIDEMLVPNADKRIEMGSIQKNVWLEDRNLHIKLKKLYERYGLAHLSPLPLSNSPPHKKFRSV